MNSRKVHGVVFATFFFGCLFLGCSKGPELGTVTGKVTLDGKPIEQATVTFTHESGHPAFARTDANGVYSLQFRDGRSGVLLGTNVVAIETARVGRDANGEMVEFPELLPAKYHRDSEITHEIVRGEQVIDFALDSE